MSSLRLRVALASTAVIGASLVAGGIGVEAMRRRVHETEFQSLVRAHLRGVAAGCEYEDGRLERHGDATDTPGLAWVVRSSTGEVLAGDPRLQETQAGPSMDEPVFVEVTMPTGGRGLAAAARFRAEDDHRAHDGFLVAEAALPLGDFERQLAVLRTTLLAGGVGTALLAAAALAVVLSRLLRPHAELADAIADLDPRKPGQRLPTAGLSSELAPVAERINDLCDRLERAYGLAASFHAAAGHELRTPLAGLRATIEVAQAGGDPVAALAACHQIALRMQTRIDNLLMAARIDAGQMTPQRDEIDIHDLLRQAWDANQDRAVPRGLTAAWDLGGSGLVEGDGEALRMVIGNLVDNAISHSPGPGGVGMTCREAGGWAEIVIDNATALDPADASRVFDRGWRSRSAETTTRHAGLGMAICRELVGIMGGRISVAVAGGRFTVAVALPAPGEFAYW